MDRAGRITDPVLRCSFLERVPEHKGLLAPWREEEQK
jgi:hypothetical protein